MRRIILIGFLLGIIGLFAAGCVLSGSVAKAPSVIPDKIFAMFPENQNVLVLPMWRKRPFFYTENRDPSSTRYYLAHPSIVNVSDIRMLSDIIPTKKSGGCVGPTYQLGREIQFLGAYLLFSNGHVFWLEDNLFHGNHKWTNIQVAWMGEKWVEQLVSTSTTSLGMTTLGETSFFGALSELKRGKELTAGFSKSERVMVKKFVENITLPKTKDVERWHAVK